MMLMAVGLILLLSGCTGPSQRIQRARDLSTSGIQYAEAVNGLLDVTIDRVIDFDSSEAIRMRKRAREDSLKQKIQERDSALVALLDELNSFRRYIQQLKAYFLNLQALADSPVQKDTGAAVRELSESIKNANNEIRGKEAIKLSKEEMEGISEVGTLVAKGVHAAKIRTALRRDAEIIGEQLVLHEKLLDHLTGILKDSFEVENDEFRNSKVVGPYINKQEQIGDQWKKDRKKWLKSQFTLESLNKAKEAAKQLGAVWGEILRGQTDAGSITALLRDINEFVLVVNEINNVNESEGGSQ
jgi:hypothetical protein